MKAFEDLSFKELEKILTENNVAFPKMWPIKFKFQKRKKRPDEEWKDQRIYMYVTGRIKNCLGNLTQNQLKLQAAVLEELLKQWKIKSQIKRNWDKFDQLLTKSVLNNVAFLIGLNIKKKNGKIFTGNLEINENSNKDINKIKDYTRDQIKKTKSKFNKNKDFGLVLENFKRDTFTPEQELYENNLIKALNSNKIRYDNSKIDQKILTKKETINLILKEQDYWKQREKTIGKSSEDQKDIALFRKEAQDFYKCTMKVSDKKYNYKFFQNLTKSIDGKSELDDFWKKHWLIIKKII